MNGLKTRDFSVSGLYITYDILSENKEVGRITVEYYSHDTVKIRNLFVKSCYRHNGFADFAVKEIIRRYSKKNLILISEADVLYLKNVFHKHGRFMIREKNETFY